MFFQSKSLTVVPSVMTRQVTINFNETDQHAYEEVKDIIDIGQQLLPDYIHTINFGVHTTDESAANATVHAEYGELTINLQRGWPYLEKSKRRQVILHEMMHSFSLPSFRAMIMGCEALGLTEEQKQVLDAMVRPWMEMQTESLARMLTSRSPVLREVLLG